jgi:hypothetical protein
MIFQFSLFVGIRNNDINDHHEAVLATNFEIHIVFIDTNKTEANAR